MADRINAPRGCADATPETALKLRYIEDSIMKTLAPFGYGEIRTPTFEHTELFIKGVGETTDVVGKEMYTFEDKGGRSITLRPEGTAGVVRAAIEHSILNEPLPAKLYYFANCFRYEKPQAGRLREFHQFGVEVFGATDPLTDAEVIFLGSSVIKNLGLSNISLQINSIGCPNCRPQYHEKLKEYFESRKENLCGTCNERLIKNPLRIIDCKSPVCSDIAKDAPKMLDNLCPECATHFETTKSYLSEAKCEYTVNPDIVRGLDYYTKTVFEFVSNDIGAQGTVLGGGRYSGLIESLGGNSCDGIGFGMGIERILLAMEAASLFSSEDVLSGVYIKAFDSDSAKKAFLLGCNLRENGIRAEVELTGRSPKAAMKYADKKKFEYSILIGGDEIESDSYTIRNMQTKEQTVLPFSEIVSFFKTK